MSALPDTGYVRISQLIGDKKANPPIEPIIPASKSTIWRWISEGNFPKQVKLGCKISAWKVEDVRAWMAAREAKA